jgi:HEAT repeat protein
MSHRDPRTARTRPSLASLPIVAALALPLAAGGASGALAAGFAHASASYAAADEGRSDRYREGQRALSESRWADASLDFAAVVAAGGADRDAALYWKAYADWQRQAKKDALEGLRELLAEHPDSSWADDARALELEIRGQRAGEARAPERVEDEELKLYALDALMQVEPEKAVPVLERILAGRQSLQLKQRALFVLSQSDSPRAREILLRTARTGEPVELRVEAVRSLAIAGEEEDLATLARLAGESGVAPEVRRALVEAYLIADRDAELLELARRDPDPRIRHQAIEALGAMEALPALRQLWGSETDPRLRAKLLEAFGIAGDVEWLARAARAEKMPELRRKAIEGLAIADSPESSRALRALYGELADRDDRRKVIEAFMIQDDAATLIELFGVERDPELRRSLIQTLSMLDDPAATELLLGLLEDDE